MNLYLLQQYKFIQNLYQDEDYLDILMNIEDFFDVLDLFVYPNWFEAEVVDMKCYRHYTNIILKQPHDLMPHPRGAQLLSKYDCIVKYHETFEYMPKEKIEGISDIITDKSGKKAIKMVKRKIWLVDIMIPNHLIINDDVYDLDTLQKKLDDDDENNKDLESVVDNNEDMALDNNANNQGNI